MLQVIGKLLLRAAIWCMHNPAKVEESFEAIHGLVEELKPKA